LAFANRIDQRRVADVLDLVGLTGVADRRAGDFSLGMGQRLGIASALLGDPSILILDEPVNGLDPDGILWIRTLLRSPAAEGRTVLVSSHLMSEMALTACIRCRWKKLSWTSRTTASNTAPTPGPLRSTLQKAQRDHE
jgi:ABC-2 type transport system ATP-binding protein